MMAVNLGGKLLAGFDEPIEMLKDCHRRIEHFLEVLQKVEQMYGDRELDREGRCALEAAVAYFASFALRHTADEEESLFPRMRSCEDPRARAVMAALEHLESDHRRCEAGHLVVENVVRDWLQSGRLDEPQRQRLRAALTTLSDIYAAHIRLEEEQVFALASRLLDAGQVRAIGAEMQERRARGTAAPV